jgi:hypothetical protein
MSDQNSLSFHRSFALNLPAVSQVLRVAAELADKVTDKVLRQTTDLGTVYVEAMPRYARRSGLLEMGSYRLTRFGEAVRAHDPDLRRSETLWLMHYHLSAPHGPGPKFWHKLVSRHFRPGEELQTAALAKEIANFAKEQTGREVAARTCRSSASVFLSTYTKLDGLGRLGLIEKPNDGRIGGGRYRVLAPEPPPIWALAYALADYWEGNYAGQVGVNLSDLAAEHGFAGLFMLGTSTFGSILAHLQRENVLEVHRIAPPYQIVRRWEHT